MIYCSCDFKFGFYDFAVILRRCRPQDPASWRHPPAEHSDPKDTFLIQISWILTLFLQSMADDIFSPFCSYFQDTILIDRIWDISVSKLYDGNTQTRPTSKWLNLIGRLKTKTYKRFNQPIFDIQDLSFWSSISKLDKQE